jgi:endosialidase-like protein
MKNFRSLLIMMSVVFALASVHTSVVAQTTDDESKLAAVSASQSIVRWQVAAPHAAVTMTVSAPDGQVFRKEFKAGTAPEFMLFDKEGNKLADGQYNYELRLTPAVDSGVKTKLAASRVETDDEALPEREMRKRGALPTPLVQSGTFTILNGSVIVAGSATEVDGRTGTKIEPIHTPLPVAKTIPSRQHHRLLGLNPDQVIPDDLIVQGSLCVGLDCVNNESFGFDTIRLKENNTRIKFDDTSTSAGFPANDWQLTANDSASGGQSKFSIEDITGARVPFTVEAGSTTNSIYIDSTGRVGFRTSTPVLDLHVNTGNTPALRLEQNTSSGFSAQTWDVAGNEANFFVRDVTGGSRLPFRIRPGAPTSSIDIAANGNVGIGTASPSGILDVSATTPAPRLTLTDTASLSAWHFYESSTLKTGVQSMGSTFATTARRNDLELFSQSGDVNIFTNSDFTTPKVAVLSGGNVGIGTAAPDQKFSVNGDASKTGGNTWLAFSDERLKTVKGQFNTGLKALMQLQPIRYEYKRNNALGIKSEGEHIGFGAQAVQNVIPEAVTKTESGYLMVNGDPILWTMLNAIKEQQKEIEQLKAEIQLLKTASQKRK